MMMNIWLENKAAIYLVSMVGFDDGIEPNADIFKWQ
jgi:hypothetical protein